MRLSLLLVALAAGLAAAQDKPTDPVGRADRQRLPPAQRLDTSPRPASSRPDRPAAEHPPPGRRPARPGRHQRVQRARAVARRPRGASEGRRQRDRPPELVRPGPRRRPRARSGGPAAAATCSTPSTSKDGKLTRTSDRRAGARRRPSRRPRRQAEGAASRSHFRSGLCLDADGKTLYSLDIDAGTLVAPSTSTDGDDARPRRSAAGPTTSSLGRNGTRLYVSDWAGRQVLVVDPADLRIVARIAVGEHPNQIAVHPEGRPALRRLRLEQLRRR